MELINQYKDTNKRLKKLYTKTVGRPPVYNRPEDMVVMIEQYVDKGCKIKNQVIGKRPNQTTIEIKVLTLMGICLHLGFTSIKQMYNFSSRKDGYAEPISYAKTLITQYYEEKMQEGVSPTAMIFMLHNLTGMSMNMSTDEGDQSKAAPVIEFTRADNDTKIRKMNGFK